MSRGFFPSLIKEYSSFQAEIVSQLSRKDTQKNVDLSEMDYDHWSLYIILNRLLS